MLIGFGLILLALKLIVAASEPMRASEVTALVLGRLAHDPVLALVFAAAFTWVMHSSVAFVLFVISLTGAGLIGLPLALTLVLGANAGAGLVAFGLALDQPVAGAAGDLRQPRLPGDRRARGLPRARAGHRGGRAARRRPGPAGGAFPHALQPRPRRGLPAADRTRRAAPRAALPRPRRARGAAARAPRPGAPRPAGAGAERRDPGGAGARRQGRADAARDDPDLRRPGRPAHPGGGGAGATRSTTARRRSSSTSRR